MYIVNKKKQVAVLPVSVSHLSVIGRSRRIHSRPGGYQTIENQAEKIRLSG